MGYVDSTPSGIASSEMKRAYKAALDEGVCYGVNGDSGNDKAEVIKNMWLKNGVLTSRKKLADTGLMLDGDGIHSGISCFGYEFFHCGNAVYAVGDGKCVKINGDMSDKNSFFVEFSGKLYFYCDKAVYSIGKDLSVKEELPYCPLYSSSCLKGSGNAPKREDFVPNILAPCCSVTYSGSLNDSDYRFYFPNNMDKTRIFDIYVDGKLVDKSLYTYDEDAFVLPGELYPGENKLVSVHYFATGNDFDKCGIITDCKAAVVYGGNTSDGTMVIAAGNPDYPGRYFISELADPLSFKEDSYGVAGNGNEDITAFSKQHSELIIFTENTVNRMKYNYSSETGGYFSVHTINSDIGCDVSKSVAVVDNRTVFANSKKGIFILDSTDGFDVLNIMRISGNITDADKNSGYFSADPDERLHGCAAVYDGKYMLLCGDSVFIWDFGNSPYVSSSDYVKAEKKLTWFEFDGFDGSERLFSANDELYVIKKNGDGVLSVYGFASVGEECRYIYRSGNSGLSYPFSEKYVTWLMLGLKCAWDTGISIDFYADGELYCSDRAHVRSGKDGHSVYCVKIPKHACRRFAFEIRCDSSDTGFTGIEFGYLLRKDMKNYRL